MTVIDIDETTEAGREILRHIAENPQAGNILDLDQRFEDFDDEDDDFPDFPEEEIERMRAEIIADNLEEDEIPLDENGNPIGYTVEEVFAGVDKILSEAYGIDFAKVYRLVDEGKLRNEDLTEEFLNSPEFEYKPYPGFKPKHAKATFKPEPLLMDAL